jgi:hypothetical protein
MDCRTTASLPQAPDEFKHFAIYAVHLAAGMVGSPPPVPLASTQAMSRSLRCSIVLPSYNRRNVLPRAVESVLAQDVPGFELIIVDDSTDETREWLKSLSDPRIVTIFPPQRRGDFATLAADWRAFRDAGLLQGSIARIWRSHREVRKYRRANSNRGALMRLSGAPADWT